MGYKNDTSQGPFGKFTLNPLAGEAKIAVYLGRVYIQIHGGYTGLFTQLRPTEGCVRTYNQDQGRLRYAISDLLNQGLNNIPNGAINVLITDRREVLQGIQDINLPKASLPKYGMSSFVSDANLRINYVNSPADNFYVNVCPDCKPIEYKERMLCQ